MPRYTVKPDDTLARIASSHGMHWRELYFHPRNEALREERPDPDRIRPGDRLWVPRPSEGEARKVLVDPPVYGKGVDTVSPRVLQKRYECVPYKVRTGDTLENIAERIGETWESIAELNWLTTDPDLIDYYLENYFVCTQRCEGRFIFTSADDPGLLLLPTGLSGSTERPVLRFRASRHPE